MEGNRAEENGWKIKEMKGIEWNVTEME